jgi:hypothetical protein
METDFPGVKSDFRESETDFRGMGTSFRRAESGFRTVDYRLPRGRNALTERRKWLLRCETRVDGEENASRRVRATRHA